jgi:uroporphyrinogen decarboxylase
MAPRERILTALNHQIPDRTPTGGGFHPEVQQRLMKHFRTSRWADVEAELGLDGHEEISVRARVPEFERQAQVRTVGQLKRKGVWLDERTYRDEWGVVQRIGESGWYEEWVSGPLADADGEDLSAVESLALPRVEDLAVPPDYDAQVRRLKERGCFVEGEIRNPYKMAWLLRGMDNLLADYLLNRDFVETLYDRLYALYGAMARREAQAGVDMISIWGDVAMQDRIVMGPEVWRAVDKPRLARLVADCRRISPGLHVFFHSDGALTDLVGDLVEIGFDVINPIQPECMDPVAIKRRWGDRITLDGGISVQRTLPYGTPQQVRAEVEHLIGRCGYNGGLVAQPSNGVQPDCSVENILACYETIKNFDVAALGGKPR